MPSRVTIKDVATRAQVSYQTVSKVVNGQAQVSNETRERIWQAIHDLGYRPHITARNLRVRASHMLGYSWRPVPPDQFNPILDKLLQSMVEAAEKSGYHLLPFPCPPDHAQIQVYRELIFSGRVDGFVLSSTNLGDQRIAYLLDTGFPFVAFGRANPEWDFPYVDVDGAAGLRAATEHLLSLGHQRIALIGWPEDSLTGKFRVRGYLEAMQAASRSVEPSWIARGEHSAQFGETAARQWLDVPTAQRPTAIIALSDLMAIGAMNAIQERGLEVGKDIAVVGFDDVPMAQYLRPPLTSLRQPIWEIGQQIVAMLIKLVRGEPLEEPRVLLPPRLIARASSGAGVPG
jgi:DNA-binding LacI/PurR family transcriptional regulator